MLRPLRTYALIAVLAIVAWIAENVLFGSDTPGVEHDVSVGFFFLGVAGVLGLVAVAVAALVRRVRSTAA